MSDDADADVEPRRWRVLWVDDNAGWRSIIETAAERRDDLELVAVATPDQFRRRLRDTATQYDLVLVDLDLGGGVTGARLLDEVYEVRPTQWVGVLTGHHAVDNGYLATASTRDPHAYISKEEDPSSIVRVMVETSAQQRFIYVSPALRDAVGPLITPRGRTALWARLDDECRELLIAIARTETWGLTAFLEEIHASRGWYEYRWNKIRTAFAETLKVPDDVKLSFDRVRGWAREHHLHEQ